MAAAGGSVPTPHAATEALARYHGLTYAPRPPFAADTPGGQVWNGLQTAARQSPDGLAHLSAADLRDYHGLERTQQSLDDIRRAIQAGLGYKDWYREFARRLTRYGGPLRYRELRTHFGVTSTGTKVPSNMTATIAVPVALDRLVEQQGTERIAQQLAHYGSLGNEDLEKQTPLFQAFKRELTAAINPPGGTRKLDTYDANLARALRVYAKGEVESGGPKTPSYVEDMLAAHENAFTPHVTNDSWQATLFGINTKDNRYAADPAWYDATEAVFTHLARELGITPQEAQAAAWYTVRTLGGTGKEAIPGLRVGSQLVSKGLQGGTLPIGKAIDAMLASPAARAKFEAIPHGFKEVEEFAPFQHALAQYQARGLAAQESPFAAKNASLVFRGTNRSPGALTGGAATTLPGRGASPLQHVVLPAETAARRTEAELGAPSFSIPFALESLSPEDRTARGLSFIDRPHLVGSAGNQTVVSFPGGTTDTARYYAALAARRVGLGEASVSPGGGFVVRGPQPALEALQGRLADAGVPALATTDTVKVATGPDTEPLLYGGLQIPLHAHGTPVETTRVLLGRLLDEVHLNPRNVVEVPGAPQRVGGEVLGRTLQEGQRTFAPSAFARQAQALSESDLGSLSGKAGGQAGLATAVHLGSAAAGAGLGYEADPNASPEERLRNAAIGSAAGYLGARGLTGLATHSPEALVSAAERGDVSAVKQAVDEILYHGTAADFDRYSGTAAGGTLFGPDTTHLATHPEAAAAYADEAASAGRGQNVRPAVVPSGFRTLNADLPVPSTLVKKIEAGLPPDRVAELQAALAKPVPLPNGAGTVPGNTGWALHAALSQMLDGGERAANDVLAQLGVDGIRYRESANGLSILGKGGPSYESVAVLPHGLPKIRNALSGRQGAAIRTSLGVAHGLGGLSGGIAGYLTADPNDTQEQKLQRAAVGAAIGVVAASGTVAALNALQTHPQVLHSLGAAPPAILKQVEGVFRANLLTSPATHLRNIIGNTTGLIYGDLLEKPLAAGIDLARVGATRALGGTAERERYFHEIPQALAGWGQGFVGNLGGALQILQRGYHGANPPQYAKELLGGSKNPLNYVFRALEASDHLFSNMARQAELNTLAYRTARRAGLTGPALGQAVQQLVRFPSPAMVATAEKQANYRTYRQALSGVGEAIQKVAAVPGMGFFLPFVRTPYNLLKFALERSPLALLSIGTDLTLGKYARKALPGALPGMPLAPAERSLGDMADRLARFTVGVGATALAVKLFNDGRLTGDVPADPKARDLWTQQGIQAHSIKAHLPGGGETWIDYTQIPGVGVTLGLTANALEAMKAGHTDAESLALSAGQAVLQGVANQPFVTGLQTLLDTLNAPDMATGGQRLVGGIAKGMVPLSGALGAYTRGEDPTVYQAKTVPQQVQATIPTAPMGGIPSVGLPPLLPVRDRSGQVLQRSGPGGVLGGALNEVNPIRASADQPNTTAQTLAAEGEGYAAPIKTVETQSLTPAQADRAAQIYGPMQEKALTALTRSPFYTSASPAERDTMVKQTEAITRARASAQIADEEHLPQSDGHPPKYDLRSVPPSLRDFYKNRPNQLEVDVNVAARKLSDYMAGRSKLRPTPQEERLAFAARYPTRAWSDWARTNRKDQLRESQQVGQIVSDALVGAGAP